jgi:hypothetical protein
MGGFLLSATLYRITESQTLVQLAHENQPPPEVIHYPWKSTLSEALKES